MEHPAVRKPPSFATLIAKALPVGMLLVGWFGRSTLDGKITLPELIDLAEALLRELDLDVAIDIPPEVGGVLAGATATITAVTGTITTAPVR